MSAQKSRKKSGFGQWIKKNKFMLIIIAVAVAVFIAMFGNNIVKTIHIQQQKKELETSIAEEKIRGEQLDQEVKQIGTKEYIERIARQYFKMAYPDEKFVLPVEKETPLPGQQPADTETDSEAKE